MGDQKIDDKQTADAELKLDLKDAKLPSTMEELQKLLKDVVVPQITTAILSDAEKKTLAKIEEERAKIANDEKTKLYSKITSTETNNLKLQEELKKFQDQETAAKKIADEKAEKERQEKLSIEEKLLEKDKKINELNENFLKMTAKTEELVKNVLTQTKDILDKKDLEVYSQRRISESNGEIIPDLVKGNTKEEVDASIEIAKTRYKELFTAKIQQQSQQQLNDGVIPSTTQDKVINNFLGANFKDLDDKAFEQASSDLINAFLKT